jgi:putative peptide zinc metalloprotease protein
LEQPENPFLPQKNRFFFGLYTVAAVIYRWVIVLSIVMFLNVVLEPYGLKMLGRLIAAAGFFGLIVQPIWQLGKFFYMPGRMHKVKRHRVIASLAVVGTVVGAIVFIPLPYSVDCTFEVSPRDAAAVYVDVGGQLEGIRVREGEHVEAGQEIVMLSNPELELSVIRLEGEREQRKTKLRSLDQERYHNEHASGQLQQVRETLATVTQQLVEKNRELERLTVVSPAAGTVIPAPSRPARDNKDQLPTWSGSLLQTKNLGAALAESELICHVGDPNDLEAWLVIDQGDIEFVDEAMWDGAKPRVSLQLDAFPGRTLTSQIDEVAKINLEVSPAILSANAGGELNTKTDAQGRPKPLSTSYRARVPLNDQGKLQGLLCTGLTGQAKIHTRAQSIGQRLYRLITRTFRFEL